MIVAFDMSKNVKNALEIEFLCIVFDDGQNRCHNQKRIEAIKNNLDQTIPHIFTWELLMGCEYNFIWIK